MDLLGQSSLVLSLTSFALGFSVLSRNPKNKVFLAYGALSLVVSFWALSFALDKLFDTDVAGLFHMFFHVWLAPAGLFFVRLMVRVNDRFSNRLLGLSMFCALSLSLALGFDLSENMWILQAIYFSPALIFIQTIYMMWVDRSIRLGATRTPKLPAVGIQRKVWVYLGALFVLAASVTGHVPGVDPILPTLGNAALAIYLFLISQAITQQRLLNFGALISRLIVLLTIALTLTGIYFILVAWIEDSPGLFFLNSFIASFLILMLLDPLRSVVGYLNQTLLSQTHRRLISSLREAQRRLTGITEPGALYQSVLNTLEGWLSPQAMAFYVLRSDGTRFHRVRSALYGGSAHPIEESRTHSGIAAREVLANHSLLEGCLRLHRRGELPILLDQILENEIDRSTSRLQKESLLALVQGLRALGGNLLIPLMDGERILGFIVLDVPNPPEPWGSNWGLLQVIYPFFGQVAETLRNMDVFVRQREKERLAELGAMAAGLAHEIRNPLGAIKGAAQFLDPSADRPESRFLGIIVEEVDRLNRVVTQFLDFSKPWGGEMRLLDLPMLVDKTLEKMRPGIPPQISVSMSGLLGKRQTVLIMGAAEQLQQVMINLVQNSIKAIQGTSGGSRSGKIQLSLEVDPASVRNRQVYLMIEDDGEGIKRVDLEKIFVPFFTTHPQGTGLGLPICQKIIEAHRGRIEVVSEERRFTRFTVTLPIEVDQVRSGV